MGNIKNFAPQGADKKESKVRKRLGTGLDAAEAHFAPNTTPLKFNSFSDFVQSLNYTQISFDYKQEDRTLWVALKPDRPCYTLSMLQELNDFHSKMRHHFTGQDYTCTDTLHFLVWKSDIPGIFNLGGDLPLFIETIRSGDREKLRSYAYSCVEAVFNNYDNFGLPIINVALVQGDALGGGFESVLSSSVVIAEKSTQFGLPEVIFNMFPGMGAFSLLMRRLNAAKAEQMILNGRICSAAELQDIGLVDIIADDGDGEKAVNAYIKRHRKSYLSISSIHRVRKTVFPMTLSELRDVTDIWVETAFKVSDFDLKKMERLSNAQEKRLKATL
jgi:DSF synthase